MILYTLRSTIKESVSFFKYLSFRRVKNYIGLQLSYFFSRHGYVYLKGLSPFFISIEPSNYCQLNCPECPVGNATQFPVDKANMKFSLFQNLVDELKPTLIHIIFYFQGEPLLNRQLVQMVDYAHKAKLYTSTSTNAQSLTSETAKNLVLSGLDKIIISIDGTSQEVYGAYRIGGELEKAFNGVKYLVEWKQKLNSFTPFIEIQFIVFKTNEHQMNEMKAVSMRLGADRLRFKTAQLYDYEHGHILMPSIQSYNRYLQKSDGTYTVKSKQPNHCWRLWNGAVVSTHGELVPCCFDKNRSFAFGSVLGGNFNTTWHNKKASDFRASILLNRKQYEICRNCTSKQ